MSTIYLPEVSVFFDLPNHDSNFFRGGYNIQPKIVRLPNFIMLFQLLPTKFFKSGLFS